MLYTENTKKAIKIMFEKHKEQVDISKTPYVFHPWHIAEQMNDEDSTIVALLHDVLEDTDTKIEELLQYNFNDKIIEALVLLKHNKDEDYYEYIEKISQNELARKVKLEDLKHNADLTRLNIITEEDLKRQKKYQSCITYLENINKEINKQYQK